MAFDAQDDLGAMERDEWSYSPGAEVGPFRFGMTLDEVVEAAELLGQAKISDCPQDHTIFSPTRKVEAHRRGAARLLPSRLMSARL